MGLNGYHACDVCGKNPTFYAGDERLTFSVGAWRYGYMRRVKGVSDGRIGYQFASLCNDCELTHRIEIVPNLPTPTLATTQRSA